MNALLRYSVVIRPSWMAKLFGAKVKTFETNNYGIAMHYALKCKNQRRVSITSVVRKEYCLLCNREIFDDDGVCDACARGME